MNLMDASLSLFQFEPSYGGTWYSPEEVPGDAWKKIPSGGGGGGAMVRPTREGGARALVLLSTRWWLQLRAS